MLVSGLSVAVAVARIEPLNAADTVVGMPRLVFLVIPFTSVTLFSLLAGLGLWYRRVADVHKRFLLLATIALLPPALGRIPALAARGPAAFFGVTILFIVLVGHDYWTRGRTHPVSLWAGLVLVVSFPGRVALGYTTRRSPWLTAHEGFTYETTVRSQPVRCGLDNDGRGTVLFAGTDGLRAVSQ